MISTRGFYLLVKSGSLFDDMHSARPSSPNRCMAMPTPAFVTIGPAPLSTRTLWTLVFFLMALTTITIQAYTATFDSDLFECAFSATTGVPV